MSLFPQHEVSRPRSQDEGQLPRARQRGRGPGGLHMVAANESNITMLPTDRRPVVFPGGLPGFPDLRRFHLVVDPSFSPPFELLASEDDAAVAFYVIDPALIDSGYAPQMPPTDWAQIQAGPTDDVCLRVIITVGSDAQHTTANLAAPLVLNLTAGLGCQSILEDDSYSLRTPLIAHEG